MVVEDVDLVVEAVVGNGSVDTLDKRNALDSGTNEDEDLVAELEDVAVGELEATATI